MKKLIVIALLCAAVAAPAAAQQQLVITLSHGITWEKMFGAGFRPQHVRDGIDKCRQLGVELSVRLDEDSEPLNLGRGDIEFFLHENHTLTQVDFYGRENRTVQQARAQTERFVEMFGEHVRRKSAIRIFSNTGKVDASDASSQARVGKHSIVHSFRHSYVDDEPLIEDLSFSLETEEVRHLASMRSPIEPPVGYEQISLNPRSTDNREDRPSAPETDSRQDPAIVPGIPATPTDPDSGSSKKRWWLWIIVAVALIGIAIVLRRAASRRDG